MTVATAERMGISFEDLKSGAITQIPVGRVGTPDDIAHAVSFYVSEGASFVSGQVLYVAGGPKDKKLLLSDEVLPQRSAFSSFMTASTLIKP